MEHKPLQSHWGCAPARGGSFGGVGLPRTVSENENATSSTPGLSGSGRGGIAPLAGSAEADGAVGAPTALSPSPAASHEPGCGHGLADPGTQRMEPEKGVDVVDPKVSSCTSIGYVFGGTGGRG